MEIAIFFMLGMLFVLVGILVPVVLNIMSRINRIETTATDSLTQINLSIDHIHRRFEEERRQIDSHLDNFHKVLDQRSSSVDSRFDKLTSYVDHHVDRIESNITTTEVADKLKKQQING